MKTKIKRHSRVILSVVLALSMLVSCMTVGLIATDAAKITGGDEELGATTYYLWTATSGSNENNYTCQGAMTYSNGAYTASISVSDNGNHTFFINTSNSSKSTGFINYSSLSFTKTGSLNNIQSQGFWMGGSQYYAYQTSRNSSSVTSINLTFNGSSRLTVSSESGGGGGGETPASADYYIVGRFMIRDENGNETRTGADATDAGWNETSTAIGFEATDTAGLYVLHTHSTEAQLAAQRASNDSIFAIRRSSDDHYIQPYSDGGYTLVSTPNTNYSAYDDGYTTLRRDTIDSQQKPDKRVFKFSGTDTTKLVDIYFDTRNSAYKLYYTRVDPPYYSYYMQGRLGFDWSDSTKDHPFVETDVEDLYVYHTGLTPDELNDIRQETYQYFFVGRSFEKQSVTSWYQPSTTTSLTLADKEVLKYPTCNSSRLNLFYYFDDGFTDNEHFVDIYFDISDPANPNLYFTLVTPEKNYYIEGRFAVRDEAGTKTEIGKNSAWASDSKAIPFTQTSPNHYMLKTNSTLTELAANVGTGTPYFYIGEGLDERTPTVGYYPTIDDNKSILYSDAGSNINTGTTYTNKNFLFSSAGWTETYQFVNLYLDTSGSTPVLSFELVDPIYNYYIEGSMTVFTTSARSTTATNSGTWTQEHTSTTLKFEKTSTSGLYKFETYKTVSELTSGNYLFILGRGVRELAPTKYFRAKTSADKELTAIDANKKFEGEWTDAWEGFGYYHYTFEDSTCGDLVTFYYNENTDNFYFMLTPAEYDTTIYVIDNSGWTDTKAYLYKDSTAGSFGAWGGQLLSGHIDYGKYDIRQNGNKTTIKFNKGTNDKNIIFNENGSNSNKTPDDIAVQNGKTYVITGTGAPTVVDGDAVSYIAKDGTVRDNDHKSFGEYATTAVTAVANKVSAGTSTTAYGNTHYVSGWAVKGAEITVTTTINETYRSKYYVAGFSFNGETPELLAERNDGVYTCTYKIPEDFDDGTLEITPIFFLKKAYSNFYVTFNISGYESVKNEGWGDSLYIYPFYANYYNSVEFGTYPGQQVIKYGGQFYTQIPTTHDGTASGKAVKGITINNGYWDLVHQKVEGWPSDNKAYHHQTYDYDDFYKIFKENGSNLNSIYFTFKYEDAEAHRDHTESGKGVGLPVPREDSSTAVYRSDNIPNTLTQAQLDAYNSKNGFEDYINSNGKKIDLFGEVLSGADLSKKPIYVISQGYEYNNSGSFATEWDVFYWDAANNRYQKVTEPSPGTYTSIVPSILHIKNYADIETNYPAVDGDLPVSDYKGMYRALETYRNTPVKICYEQDVKAGYFYRSSSQHGNDEAYRCDGVWSYTLKTDFVSANTLIEYSLDNGASWYEDEYSGSTATGTTTRCKAYFTYISEAKNGYSPSCDGATAINNEYVDDSKYFTFKAESAGQFEFVGWTLRDAAGHESKINYDSEYAAETKMSSTVTLIARFKKVSSGKVNISHTLDTASEGLGTTFLGIRILDNENTEIEVIADPATNKTAKTIGSEYIKSDSTNKIEVTLRTVVIGENTFNKFQLNKNSSIDNVDSDAKFLPTGDTTTVTDTTTKTITFDVQDLFSGTNLTTSSLDYYSLLNKALNKYEVTYNYKDRNKADKSMKLTGEFTPAQIKAYVTGSGISKTVASGFFDEIKPKVSNFKNDITFNFAAAASASTTAWSEDPENHTYTMTVTVNSDPTATLNRTVTFKTPYAMTKFIPDEITAEGDYKGTYEYISAVESLPITGQYGNLVKINDGSFDLTNGSFVTAPKTLIKHNGEGTEDDQVYYFKCWNMYTSNNKFVAACYFPEFNYLLYDNYTVEAEYSTDRTKYYEYFNTQKAVSATFLKNTRTQWNTGAESTSTPEADLIYSDFALSFKYGGMKFYEDGWSSNYEIGIILQRLDPVDMDSDGAHTKTIAQYESKYSGALSADRTKIINYIKGSVAAPTGTRKTTFTYDKLDNKNRMEYYIGQYNSKSWDETNQTWVYSKWDNENSAWTTGDRLNTNSQYVYRLFTYVYDINAADENKVLLSDPAYFYMYNTVNQ